MDGEKTDVTPEEKPEEKKGGKVSGFFKNIGHKINDATYDMRADGDFNKNHPAYTVYTGPGTLSHCAELHCEEHLDGQGGYLVAPSEDKVIAAGHVIVNPKNEAFYIGAVEKTEITFSFEDKQNTRPALKIVLGGPAERVEVIKANEVYYLKK